MKESRCGFGLWRCGRWKVIKHGEWLTMLPPSSFILALSSFRLHPSSFILALMTQVDFYLQVDDKPTFVCQIAAKAVSQKMGVLIYTATAADSAALDSLMWTKPALGFLPHCQPTHRLAAETPVIIAHEPHEFLRHDVLVNLRPEWPPFFSRFERLVEIVSNDETDKSAARARWKFYNDRGYPLRKHDMAAK